MDVRGMVIVVHHLAQQHLIGVFDSCRSPLRNTLAVLYSFCYISICWLAEPLPADTNAAGRLCLFLSELQQGPGWCTSSSMASALCSDYGSGQLELLG